MSTKENKSTGDGEAENDIAYLFTKLGDLIAASEERMKKHFSDALSKELEPLKQQLQSNTNNINQLTIQSQKTKIDIDNNSNEISEVKAELAELKAEQKATKDKLDNMEANYTTLSKNHDILAMKSAITESRLEDQTNRGLRKTLVIRNIAEKQNENWDDTREIVVDALKHVTKMDGDVLDKAIERVHRGNSTGKDEKKLGKRDIFALFYDWNEAQEVLDGFRKHGRGSDVYIDQMYGPNTTFRRNLALKKRRELLKSKDIEQGFVDFPAKLLVKRKKTDARYFAIDDFSNTPVPVNLKEG